MKHLLMDPAFPDIVGEWASSEAKANAATNGWANDNDSKYEDLSDPLFDLVAKAEVAATRLW
jgi:hypothetical protein